MARDIKIDKSQIISGSHIGHSQISNFISEKATSITPEMWTAVFRLVETSGTQHDRRMPAN